MMALAVVGAFVVTWIILALSTTMLIGGLEELLAAIDTLNANIAALDADVDALPAPQAGGASEAQVQAAADAVAAVDAKVKAKQPPLPA